MEYYEGMFEDSAERAGEMRTVEAFRQLLRATLGPGQTVEMYPVWDGDEGHPPKGVIRLALDALAPETFFFIEQFLYVFENNHRAA